MENFKTFKDFYPHYISEHRLPRTKLFHFIGSWLVILVLVLGISYDLKMLYLVPFVGYGPAWVSHFFIEKNRPATFKYPLYSLLGDWVMFFEILKGKHRIL